MKNTFYILLFFVLISCNGNSETKTAESSSLENEATTQETTEIIKKELKTVEDIREEYQSIVSKIKDKKMDSSFFEYECDGGGGQVTYFSENGQLRMIKYAQGWEHGGVTLEYFLKDNTPFFIFDTTLTWIFDTDAKVEDATRDDMTEKRFYIIDKKLIQCLEKKFTIKSSVKNNPSSETVANKEVACSDLTELLKDYNLVLKYKNQTGKIECLE